MKTLKKKSTKTFLQKSSLFAIAFVIAALFFVSVAFGQDAVGDYRSNASTMNWNDATGWEVCTVAGNPGTFVAAGSYPGENPGTGKVLIQNTHTVTITASVPNAIGSLIVGASGADNAALTFNNIGNVNLTVTGNVNVDDGSFTVTNASGTNAHNLSIGGNLTVGSGNTFNMDSAPNDDVCNVTFNGAANQTVSGAGTTVRFNLITVNNSGTTNNDIVEILSTNFTANSSGFLKLTDGTLKLSGNYTLSNPVFTTAGYTIAAGTGVWLNNPNVTVTGQASDVTLTGSLQVTAGNYIVGINGGRSLRYSTGSSLTLDGGALTISQSFVGTNTSQTTTFNMSAGTLTVLNFASVNGNASFDISAAGSSFTISGGTIILQNENTNGTLLDYRNIAGSGTITGGTVQFGTSATPGSPTFNVGVSPATNIFPGLSLVKAATSTTVTLSTPITVRGNVLIPTGTTLNANSQNITVTGNSSPGTSPGNWTNNGTFTAGTGTVTFNGSGTQTLKSGGSSFRNILHNGTDTLRLTINALTTSGTFTNSAGTFDALTNNIAHSISGVATISGGNYVAGTGAQTFNNTLNISGSGIFTGGGGPVSTGDMNLSGGTLIAPSGTFSVFGHWNKTGGTFIPGSNTVTFGSSFTIQNITSGGTAFNNVLIGIGASSRQLLDPLTVNGTFTISLSNSTGEFNANGHTTTVTGLTTVGSVGTFGTYKAGSGTQTFNGGLTVSPAGTFIGSTGNVSATNVTINNGTLTAPSGAFTVSGNWNKSAAGVFTSGSGTNTVSFNGTNQSIGGAGSTTFNNLILSNSGTKTFGISTTVNANLSINTGVIANPGTFTHSANSLTLGGEGTAAGSFGSSSSPATIQNDTYFAPTTGIVNVGNNTCTNPSIILGTIPAICAGATSFTIPYTGTTGNPDQYSISGTGITPLVNAPLGPSPVTVNLSSPATTGSISFTLTVRKSTTGCSGNVSSSVTVNAAPNCSITGADGPVCPSSSNDYTAPAGMSVYAWSLTTANGATIVPGTENDQQVTVVAGSGCNASFTLSLTITGANGCSSTCSKTVNVNDTEDPTVATAQGNDASKGCNPTAAQIEAAFTAPTFADNCGDPAVTVSTAHAGTGCAQSDTRTWTATDGCGNDIAVSQTISYTVDTEDPTVATAQGNNASIGCNPTALQIEAAFAAPTFTDNCDDLTVTVSTAHAGSGCTQSDTRTWTATDGCGNNIAVSQTISYTVDTEDPIVATAQGNNASIGCNPTAIQKEAVFTAPTFTDNCGDPAVTVVDVHTGTGCAKSDTRTWTATDACGNDISVSQIISYTVDTEDPTVATAEGNDANTGCNPTAAQIEAAFTAPTFTDNCDDLAVTVSTAHTGSGCTQSDTRTWTATDACGNDISVSQTISYTVDIEDPTVVTAQGDDASIGCNPTAAQIEAAFTAPTFADNCGNPTITVSTAHTGTGCSQSDTRTWTAADACGNDISVSQTISYTVDIEDPTVVTAQGNNASIGCNPTAAQIETAFTAPTFADNCDDLTVTVSTAHAGTGCAQSDTRSWTATDGCGNDISVSQTISYKVDIQAPTVTNGTIGTCYATVAAAEAAAKAATTATDNCPGTLITTASTTGTCNAVITVTVTDGCGNSNLVNYNTRIDNTLPVITCPANLTVSCGASTAPAATGTATATDNCDPSPAITYSDVSTQHANVNNLAHYNYTITRTWTTTDVCGNFSTCNQIITVHDITGPSVSNCPSNIIVYTGVGTSTCGKSASWSVPTAIDNCSPVSVTSNYNPGNVFPVGVTTVTYTFTDVSGNTSVCSFTVTVIDNTIPTITCPGNITITGSPNTATWTEPTGNDNCPGWTVTRTGPAPGSTFATGVTNITYTVTDASGNQNSCSFTVTNNGSPTANCTNNNPVLYFGYSGDQTAVITATPTTGTAPYTINITMNRPLLCNQVNDAGDEVWTGGSGGTTINNTCPSNPGQATLAPVSTKTISSGSYSVTVTLMADADITVTITDAAGVTTTCTTHIHAEDVRCFAGNSGNSKITICHQTGSTKNPCVKICVDQDAVSEHLSHGDFLGKCTPDCQPPAAFASLASGNHTSPKPGAVADVLTVKVLPNPTATVFNLSIGSNSEEKLEITVFDMYGKKVYGTSGSTNQQYRFGSDFASGVYIVQVVQGKKIQTVKLIKGKG